jgi:broad specificity phosphatase PhoE
MNTSIYLIRHGESENNKYFSHLVGGQSNHTPLTDEGKNQARLLGEYLHKNKITFDKAYSSPAVRAIGTAEIVLDKTGYSLEEIVISNELLELDQGKFVGQHRDIVYTEKTRKIIAKDPWNFAAPEGESQRQVEERMLRFIRQNILNQKYERVAIFGHGLAIKCTFRGIMDSDPKHTYRIELDNTSITEFVYNGEEFNLVRLNDTSHLRN